MKYKNQVESSLFARILAMNHKDFDFYQCNFKSSNAKKDAAGKSKEGSGRVAFWRVSQMPLCFTMECNYHKGRVTNKLFPPRGKYLRNGPAEPQHESACTTQADEAIADVQLDHLASDPKECCAR